MVRAPLDNNCTPLVISTPVCLFEGVLLGMMELSFGGINACSVNSEKNIYLFRD